VHRVVGRIQIEDNLARRPLVRFQELVDKEPLMAIGLWLIL